VFWATVQNTISDTEGQRFDCSKIPYEITVLLPNQLKKKRKKLIVFAKMLIIKLFQFYNNDVKSVRGKLAFMDLLRISENSKKYQITFILGIR